MADLNSDPPAWRRLKAPSLAELEVLAGHLAHEVAKEGNAFLLKPSLKCAGKIEPVAAGVRDEDARLLFHPCELLYHAGGCSGGFMPPGFG